MKLLQIYTLLTLVSWCVMLNAQDTGTITYEQLGLSFKIPDGWRGQMYEDSYIIGHPSKPGFILLSTHSATSLAMLEQEAQVGMVDQANGISLRLSGNTEKVGSNGLAGTYEGTMGGRAAKAFVIGLLNPHGMGLLIMSTTTLEQYTDMYSALAIEIANSVQFSAPVQPPIADEWKNSLADTRLTYMESYSSVDYTDPNIATGGGYSRKEVIDLCGAGYFKYASSSNMSVTGGIGVSGLQGSSGKGAGTWEVSANASGAAVLVLKFYGGEVYEYVISYPDRELHLNGRRYFHTWTGENKPDCW